MAGRDPTSHATGVTPSAITRCPHCAARFRIRAEQVKAHAGLVRCGACRGIFDAVAHITEGRLAVSDPADTEDAAGESPRTIIPGYIAGESASRVTGPTGRTDATGAMAPPLAPPSRSAGVAPIVPSGETTAPAPAESARHEPPAEARIEPTVSVPADGARRVDDAEPTATPVRNTDYEAWRSARRKPSDDAAANPSPDGSPGYRWRKPARPMSTAERIGWAVLGLFAASALVLQGLYVFRDTIAARLPQSRPALAWLCGWVDCRIAPPRALASAGFVSSELAADPAHKGLLILTATLRNSSDTSVAFPHLILTLESTDGQPVARKVFSPVQYLPVSAKVDQGLPGNTDIEVKLYLDASQVNAVGFKVDQAYL
jgi:predicted Zn finger-like uncharacterized protein